MASFGCSRAGGLRVALLQPRVKGLRAQGLRLGAQPVSHPGVARIRAEQATQQSLDVKPGAADNDGRLAAPGQFRYRLTAKAL